MQREVNTNQRIYFDFYRWDTTCWDLAGLLIVHKLRYWRSMMGWTLYRFRVILLSMPCWFCESYTPSFLCACIAMVATWFLGVPVVVYMHGIFKTQVQRMNSMRACSQSYNFRDIKMLWMDAGMQTTLCMLLFGNTSAAKYACAHYSLWNIHYLASGISHAETSYFREAHAS